MCKPVLVFVPAILLLGGCPGLTDAQVEEAWGTSEAALTSASAQAPTGDVDLDADCTDGGSVALSGTLTQNVGAGGVEQSFDYTVAYTACSKDGIVTDGDLDWSLEQVVDGGTARQRWSYAGTLTWSGDVSGTCDLEMEAEQEASSTSASVSWSGTICDRDASVVLEASGSY